MGGEGGRCTCAGWVCSGSVCGIDGTCEPSYSIGQPNDVSLINTQQCLTGPNEAIQSVSKSGVYIV